ncbi:uncharacterized protein LOC143670601 [Tamandua tetradactyla]|uniref:uncharacterized protein LOC143670601 n=1 Tax=Tamandua tetradactyla TaxID=48850 RepID=UPI00405395F3
MLVDLYADEMDHIFNAARAHANQVHITDHTMQLCGPLQWRRSQLRLIHHQESASNVASTDTGPISAPILNHPRDHALSVVQRDIGKVTEHGGAVLPTPNPLLAVLGLATND